ncbi:probable 39S ribosomal protein L45, mitochondrial [Macrosteles quadrilineatus]|uniref:probable 39S ribosomal protein L45, mitochondrial n=1 Tax=Macrosteles quadrilineatus TaxID=74068 RepID=UPI0023E27583|nr:probable 39S ribosomal protein L45, mitochondrial [Macrosteles quadrilineatus]
MNAANRILLCSVINPRIFNVLNKNVLKSSICTTSETFSKHWNPKFKKLRAKKVIKVELPDYDKASRSVNELSKEEIRSIMKEKGILPSSPWMERPYFISTTGEIVEPYVPPEGDGKVSFITKEGAKQNIEFIGKKGKSLLALRKLRKFDDDFELDDFLITAQDVYMKAHNAMMKVREDKEELQLYVTERAYPQMIHNVEDKTIHWKMIGLLDPPRLVQARTVEIISKDNLFCQLTVRFHTQQTLAIYDRFGRLLYGSEILAKDVLEYVIFEKHLSNKYGRWRIHAKIIPDWMPPKEPARATFRIAEDLSPSTTQVAVKGEVQSPSPSSQAAA